jgi:hypothetical protein
MWRTISRILLIKSFVLGALVLCVWARSYYVSDAIVVEAGGKSTRLAAANGVIIYRAAADGSNDATLNQFTRHYKTFDPNALLFELPNGPETIRGSGFSYSSKPMYEDGNGLIVLVTIPCWLFFILASSKAIFFSIRKMLFRASATSTETGWCAACQSEQPSNNRRCLQCGGVTATV